MNDLQNQVQAIANHIRTGKYDYDPTYDECEYGPSAADYLSDALDIEYVISGNGDYLGARVLVAFGGPEIWINTRTNTVEGYWGGDEYHASFNDELGVDDYLSELYECTR